MFFSKRIVKRTAREHFKGTNYYELYDYLRIDTFKVYHESDDLDQAENDLRVILRGRIQDLCDDLRRGMKPGFRGRETLLACRAFTYAYSRRSFNPLWRVWRGLYRTVDDEEFLKFFLYNVHQMW